MKPRTVVFTLFALALLALATPPASAQFTFDLLHTFTGYPTDGNFPTGGVIQDADGNLYGTTVIGGTGCVPAGCGTVFKIDKNGQYTVLYRFLAGNDGSGPVAGLARDAAGTLYGTTQGRFGVSTVFKVDNHGTETVLFRFTNYKDGGAANSTPVLDAEGNLYATAPVGGDVKCNNNGYNNGCGVVFRLSNSGAFKVLHTFTSLPSGAQPNGNLVMDGSGNLYGTTVIGGDLSCPSFYHTGCGTVFEISKNGKFTVLYRFHGKADGSTPASVVGDSAGNLYGIADAGGVVCSNNFFRGCGTIFKIDNAGKFSVLYKFDPKSPGLMFTFNNLVRDSKGNLYGTNQFGGTANDGYLFELDAKGKFSVLYNFPGYFSGDGNQPTGAIMARNGDFYGTLANGGDQGCGNQDEGCGTVFKLTH